MTRSGDPGGGSLIDETADFFFWLKQFRTVETADFSFLLKQFDTLETADFSFWWKQFQFHAVGTAAFSFWFTDEAADSLSD